MSDVERQIVERILRAAGFGEESIAWMASSCPDVQTAERVYGTRRNPYLVEEQE